MFIDTAYLVGFVDRNDPYRGRAQWLAMTLSSNRSPLVTTEAILVELLNYFSATRLRSDAVALVASLRLSLHLSIIEIASEIFEAALARYQRFDDKNWSMTDCLSMEVMLRRGITQIATSDRGFQQAGFEILMPAV